MKKFLFSVCAVLAILGCGGENIEDLPPLKPGRNYGGDSLSMSDPSYEYGYGYCLYYNGCKYMSVNDCYNYYGGSNYGNNSSCGGNYYSSSSSNRSSSSINSSSSVGGYNSSSSNYDYPSSQSTGQSSSSSFLSSSSSVPVFVPIGRGNSISSYSTIKIGDQIWMAENLNYTVPGSKCYGDDQANCDEYGQLYDWATAMALPSNCNSNSCSSQINSPHRGICPSGWHIPSNADWDKLFRYADGTDGTSSPYDSPTAGRYLKATSGWSSCGPSGSGSSYLCEDTYGFSALPGGYGSSDGYFSSAGYNGNWWSASESNSYGAYNRDVYYYYEDAYWYYYDKSNLFSVRCLQD